MSSDVTSQFGRSFAYNYLRRKPRMIIEAANCDIDQAGPSRVLAVYSTSARRAEMPGVDVAAFGGRGITRRRPRDCHVVALEAGQRHVAGTGRLLAVLAVALAHADRLRTD